MGGVCLPPTASECLRRIRGAISTATGCTEPAAIALCAAAARAAAPGTPIEISVRLDRGLYKNAVGVVIPGVNRRGAVWCAALGVAAGEPADGLDLFARMGPDDWNRAAALAPLVRVCSADACSLYVEVAVQTEQCHVRAVMEQEHGRISRVEHFPFPPDAFRPPEPDPFLRALTLEQMLTFAREVPAESLEFLQDTIQMNRVLMEKGLEMGYGRAAARLGRPACAAFDAQLAVGAASWARMAGVPLPAATATGSGNQGITLSLTVDAAARFFACTREQTLRALALGHLVNLTAKSYIGVLAPLCSSGIASGVGAAAAVAWLLDGTEPSVLGGVQNMLGSIGGMLCDGAKEGCAHKAALAAYAAVTGAQLAAAGCHVPAQNGVCAGELHALFQNMSRVIFEGMGGANETMLSILAQKGAPSGV